MLALTSHNSATIDRLIVKHTMENQESDPIMQELLEAATREMEFYREIRKRNLALSLYKPKAELNSQQKIAYERSNCNPILKELAKTIIEEIQFNRNERRWANRLIIWSLAIGVVLGISIPLIIIWSLSKSSKHK